MDKITQLLNYSKSTCEALMKSEKLWTVIGTPDNLVARTRTNAEQNKRKKAVIEAGKRATQRRAEPGTIGLRVQPTGGVSDGVPGEASELAPSIISANKATVHPTPALPVDWDTSTTASQGEFSASKSLLADHDNVLAHEYNESVRLAPEAETKSSVPAPREGPGGSELLDVGTISPVKTSKRKRFQRSMNKIGAKQAPSVKEENGKSRKEADEESAGPHMLRTKPRRM
ncbi:uncharacterized protein EI97DRAFT_456341 [Westerdykella ornata]|uniref:Uncharacterized protein n=1 Tax=Westerdykella ornata TaxID=318751 RepID=A0A6A6JV43_WESOR|nr:uncharacterized protein EI97DRAFT_456341 [Westerdykella ornata]KAF2278909.1 hypothetical protein EI97DRAFT_456341 [Westerdykella ornata]